MEATQQRAESKVLDYGFVRLIDKWGSEEQIISSARMSTSGSFKGWDKPCPECKGSCRGAADNGMVEVCSTCQGVGKLEGDSKLLRYLWEHQHLSPFEMAGATFEMQLPIFVARELVRHRTFSFNELSARYTALPDLYYIPTLERLMAGKQASKNKQGSEDGFNSVQALSLRDDIVYQTGTARATYDDMIAAGVSRELARLVIPVNQYTRWRMSGNLRNWCHMLELRLGEGVQWECQEYAKAVEVILQQIFPRTMSLFSTMSVAVQ